MARSPKPNPHDTKLSQDMTSLLSIEEQAELLKEAKQRATDQMKTAARERFLDLATAREMRKISGLEEAPNRLHEETEDVQIILGTTAFCIMIDSTCYWHGMTYRVTGAVAESLKDIMYQTHRHEAEVTGQNMNSFYGKKRLNTSVSPRGSRNLPH